MRKNWSKMMWILSIMTFLIEFIFLGFTGPAIGNPDSLIVFLIVIFSVAFLFDLNRNFNLVYVRLPLTVGYFLRLGFLFIDLYCRNIIVLPGSGNDSERFYMGSVRVALGGDNVRDTYSNFMGRIFSWTEPSRIYGQFLNMLFTMIALCILAYILQKAGSSKYVKQKIMWIICILPNCVCMSVVFLREAVMMMLSSYSLYLFVKWLQEGKKYLFWMGFLPILCASVFHSGMIAMAVGYIVVRFLYDEKKRLFRLKLVNVISTIFLVFIFVFLYVNYSNLLFGKMSSLTRVADALSDEKSYGGSSYMAYVGAGNSIGSFILQTVPRMIYFLYSPFPWQWRGIGDIIAFCFDSLFYLITSICVLRYICKRIYKNRNIILVLSIVALCIIFVFSWGTANTGTAIRHRNKMIIIFGLLYALSSPDRKKN